MLFVKLLNYFNKLVIILFLVPLDLKAQLEGEWQGQATSVAQLTGNAKASIKVSGNTISGSFQTQMNGMISVNFEGQLINADNATCLGYVDGQPAVYVFLSKEGPVLSLNMRTDASDFLYASFQKKAIASSTGTVNENIVGTWKIIKYETNTKITMFWKISEEGFIDGYQNTFWMTGYDKQGRNLSSESTQEPIPFLEKLKQIGGKIYTKGGKEVWLKIPGEKDEKFFNYQIINNELNMLFVHGISNKGERVGF